MKKKLNVNKTTTTVIILNLAQIFLVIGVMFYRYFNGKGTIEYKNIHIDYSFFILVIVTSIVISFLTIRNYILLNYESIQFKVVKDTLQKVESLNNILRGQRHDFMNHLQVVYGLIEMKEYEASGDYIEKVFKDIQKVNLVLKTQNPAVNALLQAKILFAEKRDIKVDLRITSQLKDLKIPSWEFCRVLGNIIDNSIYALSEIEKDKFIEVEIYEDLKFYCFKIINNGPKIPHEILEKIFEAGFTTKGKKGEGMGLSITKEILENYGGDIKVISNNENTVFEGCIRR